MTKRGQRSLFGAGGDDESSSRLDLAAVDAPETGPRAPSPSGTIDSRNTAGDHDRIPLAERMRPAGVDEVFGHQALVGPGTFLGGMLRGNTPPRSLMLWGPPGSGKTTIARLLAGRAGYAFVSLSAVLGGVKELRELLAEARDRRRLTRKGTILFVDEIHRFHKGQQDAFLPHV